MKFGTPKQNAMPMKLEVEFQHGGRPFSKPEAV